MKRIICFALTALLLLAMVSCQKDAPEFENNETATIQEETGVGSYVVIGEKKLGLGDVFDEAKFSDIGTLVEKQEAISCHYDGFDTIFVYENMQVYTYLLEEKLIVYSIELNDDSNATPEGAKVGMTLSQISEIYGTEYTQLPNGISYSLAEEGKQLNFRMKDDQVFCIEYYME